jgi:hypothetical protein
MLVVFELDRAKFIDLLLATRLYFNKWFLGFIGWSFTSARWFNEVSALALLPMPATLAGALALALASEDSMMIRALSSCSTFPYSVPGQSKGTVLARPALLPFTRSNLLPG